MRNIIKLALIGGAVAAAALAGCGTTAGTSTLLAANAA
jgi:hypothetical protein